MELSKEQLMYLHEQIHYYHRQVMSQREHVQTLSKNLTDYEPQFKRILQELNGTVKKLNSYYTIFLRLEKLKNSLKGDTDPKGADRAVVSAMKGSTQLNDSFARKRLSEVIQQMIDEDFHLEYEFN